MRTICAASIKETAQSFYHKKYCQRILEKYNPLKKYGGGHGMTALPLLVTSW
jgi:hypothetical protein